MNNQIYKSQNDRMICGVCGGIAENMKLNPTLVRLLWSAFSLFNCLGIVLYIIAIFVIPERK